MKTGKKIRAYFDYNIYDAMLRNQCSYKKRDDCDIFYSVAYLEEFFKAKKNSSGKDNDKLNLMKELIISTCKDGIILNPSASIIRAKREKFDDCYKIIEKYDTRGIVESDGTVLNNINKDSVAEMHDTYKDSKFNSNLSCEEIWEKKKSRMN